MKRGSGFVYIVDFGEAGIKVGYTTCIMTRMDVYRKPWCYPIKKIYYISHPFPVYVEGRLKKHLDDHISSENSTEFVVGYPIERVLQALNKYKFYSPERVGIDKSFSLELKTWESKTKASSFSIKTR